MNKENMTVIKAMYLVMMRYIVLKHVKFNSPEPTNPETSLFEKSKTINFDEVDNILKIIETENDQTNEIVTTMYDDNAKLNQYTTFDQWGLDYDQNGNMTQKGPNFLHMTTGTKSSQ